MSENVKWASGMLVGGATVAVALGQAFDKSWLYWLGAGSLLLAAVLPFVAYLTDRKPSPTKAFDEIADLLRSQTVIHAVLESAPELRHLGRLEVPDDVCERAQQIAADIAVNEYVAIVDPATSSLSDHPEAIGYRVASFAELIAMRERAHRQGSMMPLVLSGIAPVVDVSSGYLNVQKRSDGALSYPDLLGVVGGLFRAPGGDVDYRVDPDIYATVEREALEEIGAGSKTPIGEWLVTEDLRPGFLQVGPTVVEWARSAAPRFVMAEGAIRVLAPTELKASLLNPQDWTPGSLIRVLYWLAIGAPGGTRDYRRMRRDLHEFAQAIRQMGEPADPFRFDSVS